MTACARGGVARKVAARVTIRARASSRRRLVCMGSLLSGQGRGAALSSWCRAARFVSLRGRGKQILKDIKDCKDCKDDKDRKRAEMGAFFVLVVLAVLYVLALGFLNLFFIAITPPVEPRSDPTAPPSGPATARRAAPSPRSPPPPTPRRAAGYGRAGPAQRGG